MIILLFQICYKVVKLSSISVLILTALTATFLWITQSYFKQNRKKNEFQNEYYEFFNICFISTYIQTYLPQQLERFSNSQAETYKYQHLARNKLSKNQFFKYSYSFILGKSKIISRMNKVTFLMCHSFLSTEKIIQCN